MFGDILAAKYIYWLVDGFFVTLLLSAITALLATVLGFLFCVGSLAKSRFISKPINLYLAFFRNTPLLVQLFFWYFGVSAILPDYVIEWLNTPHEITLIAFGLKWPPFEYIAAIFGLTLYSSAFISEEFRAGIQGVPGGQIAAASALGLNEFQIWRFVVMPQAFRIALQPLFGQFMSIVKNTSLTMAIGVAELSYASRQVETETFKTFQVFGLATLFYILTILVIEAYGLYLKERNKQVQIVY